MKKRRIRLALVHIAAFLVIGFCVFKYPEEINTLKSEIYSMLSIQQNLNMPEMLAKFDAYAPFPSVEDAWYGSEQLIYHAGGGIDGLGYSNSKEALDATLESGHRLVEIDFCFTSDGQLACVKKWEDITNSEMAPSMDTFLSMLIYGKYTPMSADMIVEYMKTVDDLRIVVDTKEDDLPGVIQELLALCENDPQLIDRFVIQLYDRGQKSKLKELYAFRDENFLFTAYKFGPDRTGEILELCYTENISVVTVEYGKWSQEVIDFFVSKGFVIFEHTVNRRDYALSSLEKGVYGFYTDFLCEADLIK